MKRFLLLLVIGSAILAACAPAETALPAPTATAIPSTPAPTPTECAQDLVLPAFHQVEPDPLIVGEPFKLVASGGYIRDSCGGVNESARSFAVYVDDQPIGEIVCYVNHCEGDFVLPVETQAGTHCLSAKPGECSLEIQVTVR
jgi:hypothetical protein